MASLDGMLITDTTLPPTAGSAFLLNRPPKRDGAGQLGGGWTVEIRKTSKYIVARGPGLQTYEEARDNGFDAVQRFLDLHCISGKEGVSVENAEEEHLAWWTTPDGVILRSWNVVTFNSPRVQMALSVTDSSGQSIPAPPPPQVIWQKSMRFFRLSQATDDLLDAFRNLYLALESILSDIEPPTVTQHPSGTVHYEREGVWLKRAMNAAESRGLIDWSQYATPGCPTPIDDIFASIYTNTRTYAFHAKINRPSYLPQDTSYQGHRTMKW